ncbi:MAG: hypothetical protein ACUZ8H_13970 [Candidatus Anammoxibacter sp.]
MKEQTLTLKELKDKSLEEVLQLSLINKQIMIVKLPNGGKVVIQPKPQLKPLPVLDGYVPNGWKEAIYNEPE